MADSKITALAALTAADPVNDMFPVVDVSDTSMAASGTTKRISVNNILSSSPTASGALTVTGLVTAGSATITGDLTVDTSTLKVDSTNNRVGVGTATPGVRVDILSDNNTSLAAVLRVNSNNAAVNTSIAYDGVIASGGMTLQAGTSNPIIFNTNGANEAGRINTTGVYVLKGGTTTANGVGVAFPSTQVPSSDANCLDDYEEGTFTATLKGGTTDPTIAVTTTGKYTKIGRTVFVEIQFGNASTLGASGTITITGLPFTSSSSGSGQIGCLLVDAIATFTNSSLSAYLPASSTTLSLYTSTSNSVITAITHNAGTGRYLWTSITYHV
jgi:hypothetical protein